MGKILKKIAAVGTAVMMMGTMTVGASAYEAASRWEVNYVRGLPNDNKPVDQTYIPAYGGGYITDCTYESGSNNRETVVYYEVSSTSEKNYTITKKGKSIVHKSNYMRKDGTIRFAFVGSGDDRCFMGGTVGYNK